MSKKHEALDVVKMYSTLTLERWRFLLRLSVKENRVQKLVSWRYGLQAGLAQAAKRNVSNQDIDIWVIKRCRDLEKAMKYILKKKYPNPLDDPKHDPLLYIHKVKMMKKQRDKDFEDFLRRSSY